MMALRSTDVSSAPRHSAAPPGPGRLITTPPARDLASHLARFGPLWRREGPGPLGLIAAVQRAGLRGRGGASFPTGVKLAAVAESAAKRSLLRRREPIVVGNGTEGEPISAKDVMLLTYAPHTVLDGMVAAAAALGANEAILCIDRNRPGVISIVQHAVAEREQAHLDPIPIQVAASPTHYVTGEESALVHWLNGGNAIPTTTPPRPFERGVAGRPTLVDNVETLANIGLIARFGADWWRSAGTESDPGMFLATVTDGRRAPRVVEVPFGTRLGSLFGSTWDPASASGVLVGGYFGTWLRPEVAAGLPMTRGALGAVEASVGCGAVVALPADVCPVTELARVARWLANQSAGQCGPCAYGLPDIATAMEQVAIGDPSGASLAAIERWMPMVAGRGACKLPDGAVRFVSTGLATFGDHLQSHRRRACRLDRTTRVLPTPAQGAAWR